VSIPAIAREAGVSIPTIYRIFGSKRALIEAIYPYAIRRARSGPLKVPTSYADFRDGVRILFDRLDSLGELDRAAIVSRGADEVRQATMEARVAVTRQAVDGIAPGLPEDGRARVARLGIVLTQSASLRMLRDHLGLSIDEAIDDIEWMVRAAVAAARSEAST
jgi:AcrR family transcriptional regulator